MSGLRDLALIAAMFYSFARVSAVLKLKVDDYYDNGCAGEWDHLKREMPWKSPSSRRHLTFVEESCTTT